MKTVALLKDQYLRLQKKYYKNYAQQCDKKNTFYTTLQIVPDKFYYISFH